MKGLMRPLMAEFVGTFFLVFIGVGAIVADTYRAGSVGLLGIAAAHGLALAVGVSAAMNVSGGHLNPAITLGLWSVGRVDARRAGFYVLAQLLGGIVAALAVRYSFPEMAAVNSQLGTPRLADTVFQTKGIVVEAILTFLLAWAVMGTAVDSRAPKIGGFGIGITLLFCILAGGNITGGALNPARAFGPALVSGNWTAQIVYWLGPILGAVVAMQVYERVVMEKE